jgi:zinc protease
MLACLKESLFFPDFDEAEVEKLRADLVTRARQLRENNLEYIKQEFYREVYTSHPYGRATFGDEESLAAITVDELRAFHAENWRPERTLISVAGDVDPDEMAAWIASRWADLPAEPAEPWQIDPAEHAVDWEPPAETLVLDLGKNYWTVNWGRPGMPMTDPAFLSSVVLARIAGNEHFYKYVYEEGVSYRSWIAFWQHLGPGAWILENDVNRERFDEILAEFDEDLTRYSTTGFERAEFDDAQLRVVNRRVLRSQDARILAWRLAVAEGNGVGFRRETGIAEAVRKVSYDDVQALAQEVFAPDAILRLNQQ